MSTTLFIALTGLGVGFLVGMTGIGGSALMAPLLILVFGTPPSIAVGTDLAYSVPMKWVGAWQHHRQGHVRWHAVWLLSRGSVPAALIGAYMITTWVHMDPPAEQTLRRVLGATLLLVSLLILLQLTRVLQHRREFIRDVWYHHPLAMSIWGAVVGFLVGVTSIGSGSLLVPFLLLLPLNAQEVVGTDVAHAALLVTVAGAAHLWGETVDLTLAANLLVGALPGVILGSRLTRFISEHRLRGGMAILLLATSLHLLGII